MGDVTKTEYGPRIDLGFYRFVRVTNVRARPRTRVRPKPLCAHQTYLSVDSYMLGYAADASSGISFNTQSRWSHSRIDWEPLYSRLVLKTRAEIQNKMASLATAIFQYKQTVSLWSQTARSLAKALRALKRRKIPDREFARLWLQLQFGYLPLVGDIVDSYAAVKEAGKPREDIICTKTGIHETFFADTQSHGLALSEGVAVRIRCYSAFRRTSYLYLPTLLGFTDYLGIAYDLIPFSFVVDQMTNLGDMLSSVSALQGADVLSTTKDLQMKTESVASKNGLVATARSESYSRGLQFNISMSSVRFEIDFSDQLLTLANDLALLRALRPR